jgi:hypothetical protein
MHKVLFLKEVLNKNGFFDYSIERLRYIKIIK